MTSRNLTSICDFILSFSVERFAQRNKKEKKYPCAIFCDILLLKINFALSRLHDRRHVSAPQAHVNHEIFRKRSARKRRRGFPARLPGNPPNATNIKEREGKRGRTSWMSKITAMREEARGQNEFGGSGWGRGPTIVVFCYSPVLWLFRESSVFRHPRNPRSPRISARR